MKDLSVTGVDMVYDVPGGTNVHALSNVSFDLAGGRLLSLLGPSGCGKTTLLNILAGFLAPTGGSVTLGGEPITGPDKNRGMVFQQGALFEWLTVEENIAFGPHMAVPWYKQLDRRFVPRSLRPFVPKPGAAEEARIRARTEELLEIVGLGGFGDKQIYELSGGMQQRVALARCLANDPDVILMDEPLGALDALTREKMQSLVLEVWKETGKTIILVTHSVEEALYLGDRLFVMAPRPGRIEKDYSLPFAEQGLTMEPRELKRSPEFRQKSEEILNIIWEMEEEITGRAEGAI